MDTFADHVVKRCIDTLAHRYTPDACQTLRGSLVEAWVPITSGPYRPNACLCVRRIARTKGHAVERRAAPEGGQPLYPGLR